MIITKKQFIDFINNQPDDKLVNFSENYSEDSCGCPMVQFMRENQFEIDKEGCGFSVFSGDVRFEDGIDIVEITKRQIFERTTMDYKELKKIVN